MVETVESLVVGTDGASSGGVGPASWAWVDEHGHWKAGSLASSTNQVGELLGILNAVRDHEHVHNLTIETDSAYAMQTYLRWGDQHKRRGWKTADGKPTSNREVVEELLAVRDARRTAGLPDVTLVKVKGHAPKGTHPLNEAADERAVWAKKKFAAVGQEVVSEGEALPKPEAKPKRAHTSPAPHDPEPSAAPAEPSESSADPQNQPLGGDLKKTAAAVLKRSIEILLDNPNAQPREAQAKVNAAIASAMSRIGHVAELARTGTGKSFCALAPALSAAAINGERTVISTESLSLQAQILEKDAPVVIQAVKDVTGRDTEVAVLKGWSNSVCARALTAVASDILGREIGMSSLTPTAIPRTATALRKSGAPGAELVAWCVEQFADEDLPGDKHSYPLPLTGGEWEQVSVAPDVCVGVKTCPFAKVCKPAAAKAAAAAADVIVTNHSLLAVQTAKGVPVVTGSKALGRFEHIIVDEAHALPSKVRDQGSGEVSGRRVQALAAAINRLGTVSGFHLIKEMEQTAVALDKIVGAAMRGSDAVVKIDDRHNVTGVEGLLAPVLTKAANVVKEFCAQASRGARISPAAARKEMDGLRVAARIENMKDELAVATGDTIGVARWLENDPVPAIKFSPIEVGPALRANLWTAVEPRMDAESWDSLSAEEKAALMAKEEEEGRATYPLSVACISATLGPTFAAEAGLNAQVVDHPSPFTEAYANSVLFVPRCIQDDDVAAVAAPGTAKSSRPRFDVHRHAAWARDIAAELIEASGGGALVLCATKRDGLLMADHLRVEAKGRWRVLDQWSGDATRRLVTDFRDDIDSVLVGTRSLMTGTDVSGRSLRLAIIDRPPRSAGNPVDDARVEAIMNRSDVDRWTADRYVYVSDAALLLAQAAGRLIRSTSDFGMVAVLDPRLLRKNGSAFNYAEQTRRTYLGALDAFEVQVSLRRQAVKWLADHRRSCA